MTSLSPRCCPVSADCPWKPGYPDGYRDPPHGPSVADFVPVIEARRSALLQAFNGHIDEAHPELEGLRLEWSADD